MTSGLPIDHRLRQRILTLRRRVTVGGKPMSYSTIAKLLGIHRVTVERVLAEVACRT